MLQELLAQNPGLEVTPQILLGFIAEKTKSTPLEDTEERGREEHRLDGGFGHSRSLSSDSDGASYYPGSHSRPPSRGPMSSVKSPLDSERRQRSTPLANAPPSSWAKRPTPAGRRKSDAGSRSDGEVMFHVFDIRKSRFLNDHNIERNTFPPACTVQSNFAHNTLTRSFILSGISTELQQPHVPPPLSEYSSPYWWRWVRQSWFL